MPIEESAPVNELWELNGPRWRYPIHVCFHGNYAFVNVLPMPVLPRQIDAANKLVESVSDRLMGSGKGWVQKNVIETYARKSIFTDPEDIVEWLNEPPAKPEDPGQSDFIKAYCASDCAVLRDPAVMDAIFFSLVKFMLHWMLNLGRPLDLIFVKLMPFIYRKNWLAILAQHDLIKKRSPKTPMATTTDQMLSRGICDTLISQRVLAWDVENKVACWTIEAVAQTPWHEMSTRLERARRSLSKGKRYAAALISELQRQLPAAMETYRSFLYETSKPTVRFPHLRNLGTEEAPDVRIARKVAEIPVAHGHAERFTAVLPLDPEPPSCVELHVEQTNEDLPFLPHLQPGNPNLR